MKAKLLIFFLFIMMLFLYSIAFANYINYSAPVINVEVQNINEDIKSVWLCLYDDNANVTDAYKQSRIDFSSAHFLEAYPNEEYKYCAVIENEVDPFSKETYVPYTDYDKKNYIVDIDISYDYKTGAGTFGGSNEKYKDMDDFINNSTFFKMYGSLGSLNDFVKEEIESVKGNPITCKRNVYYSARRLIEQKQIATSEIKNKKLVFSINDFSEMNELRKDDINSGFAIRFENNKGEYLTLLIGTNDMHQDSFSKYKIKEYNLNKNVVLDYANKKTISNNSYITQEQAEELSKFNFDKSSWSKASDWAIDELNIAKENDLIPSLFDGRDLSQNITRREFAHIAVRLYEILKDESYSTKADNPFKDTNDEEIVKAYSIGITQGTSENEFSPNQLITREQLATMMTRLLEKMDVYTYIDINSVKLFEDDSEMASWGKMPIYFMFANDIIKGVGNNKFGVSGNATIEQSILISKRISENFESLKSNSKKMTKPEDVGSVNDNYAKALKDVTSGYDNRSDVKKVDINQIDEVQVFLHGWSDYNVYYCSREKEDFEYINKYVKDIASGKQEGYSFKHVWFVLKDKTVVKLYICINEDISNTIVNKFSKSKDIYLSPTARLGMNYENIFKDLDYTEEEHKQIISLLSKMRPLYEGYCVDHGSVIVSDVEDGYIWAYQYENKKPIAYTYRVSDSKELVSLLDKINLRKINELFKNNISFRRINIIKCYNGNNQKVASYDNSGSEAFAKLEKIVAEIKTKKFTEYPDKNYYQIWLYPDYNSFAYIKLPINEETDMLFNSKTESLVGKYGKAIVNLDIKKAVDSNDTLFTVSAGDVFKILAISEDLNWYQVEYIDQVGWVNVSSYVRIISDDDAQNIIAMLEMKGKRNRSNSQTDLELQNDLKKLLGE